MNIVFILEHFHPYIGGVEKLFYHLTSRLAEEGNKITVITTRHDKNLQKKETVNGVEIVRLKVFNRYLFTFFGFFFMVKYVRKCDLIHTTTYNAAFPAFVAGLLTKKKVVVTFHEYWGKLWFSLPFLSLPERVLFWMYEQFVVLLPFHTYIAVSDFTKSTLQKRIRHHKIIRIYNGVDYSELKNVHTPHNKIFTFTFFGRLGVSKGLDILLGACEILKKQAVDVHCNLIIPQYPKKFFKKINNEISKQNISSIISLHHHLSDDELHGILSASDCVVVPSYTEGFCFSAVETIAKGIPVIVSGKGALKEVVSGKFIVMKKHSSKGLANAILEAKEGKWETKSLIKFEMKDKVSKYMKLYKKVLSEC